jgi:hypothetical protein
MRNGKVGLEQLINSYRDGLLVPGRTHIKRTVITLKRETELSKAAAGRALEAVLSTIVKTVVKR